jgi:pimeloyl-ACP methyl ester carboxylesterase
VIFSQLFFPGSNPVAALLATFATFGVAFVVRPIGGLFFGALGDRIGRRRVLTITLVAIGGATRDDVSDLIGLLEVLRFAPAHVVGNSFGASIVLRMAAARPELFRSLIVHEPPLFGLLKDDPDAKQALAAVQERMSAVVSLLTAGDSRAGARQFVETIAFGPSAWQELREPVRETFVFNAPTWLDEVHDPDALELDLSALSGFGAPALLTIGDQSAPFFPLVVDRIAAAMPRASLRTYAGAGHVPHLSHPEEYVRVVTDFAKG